MQSAFHRNEQSTYQNDRYFMSARMSLRKHHSVLDHYLLSTWTYTMSQTNFVCRTIMRNYQLFRNDTFLIHEVCTQKHGLNGYSLNLYLDTTNILYMLITFLSITFSPKTFIHCWCRCRCATGSRISIFIMVYFG